MPTPQSRVTFAPDVLFRDLDGEAVVLNVQTGLYYGLDEVGTRIWTLLSEHGRLGTVHELLLEEYDVTPERLWDDLVRLVDEMQAEGLVEVHAAEDP